MSILDEISEKEKIEAMTACPSPVGEREFLKDVVKEDKKHSWYDSFYAGAFIMGVLIAGITMFLDVKRFNTNVRVANKHIEIVTATDKNCNDCHLGASFVNLFNNPAVKGNDNVVIAIMDKAHIKRW